MRKINIHLVLDEKTIEYVRSVNKVIQGLTKSIILFNENSAMVPHITLVMGTINENSSLENICNLCMNICKYKKPISVSIQRPYLENVRNRYVFSNLSGPELLDLKRTFQELFLEKHITSQPDYTETSHLTLAHISDNQLLVRNTLKDINADFECICTGVEISDVGPKGTCINSLFYVNLE